MFPNTFLTTFWGLDLRHEIFVAMSFDPRFDPRFKDVIEPAITAIKVDGVPLCAKRVDLSKSGDMILTDILDGIAHCQMFLADVSTVGTDKTTGKPFRNGNVMCEVGIALTCRQTTEILLVRDDKADFLFDVSMIPHKTLDFTNPRLAQEALRQALIERLRERRFIHDARVQVARSALSNEEVKLIKEVSALGQPGVLPSSFTTKSSNSVNFTAQAAIPRLLDKKVIRCVDVPESGMPVYHFTQFGYEVARGVVSLVPGWSVSTDGVK